MFLCYQAKWLSDDILYEKSPPVCPAQIDDGLQTKLQEAALAAFHAVECRDYARIDFRMDKKGKIYVLEVNPNPDISLNAGYVRALTAAGIEYKAFWQKMIDKALARKVKK